jgi:hypothetical protein
MFVFKEDSFGEHAISANFDNICGKLSPRKALSTTVIGKSLY